MYKKIVCYTLIIFSPFILFSCSASTGSRYGKEEKKEESKEKTSEKDMEFKEDFDLKNYHARIDAKEKTDNKISEKNYNDIWYEYTDTASSDNDNKIIIDKKEGFRVQVFSTDNLDDANNMRSELYFKTNQKNVYVIFDPPFYKVRVGDFLNTNEANELNFKLTQLGYSEARIVKDSVNVYQ